MTTNEFKPDRNSPKAYWPKPAEVTMKQFCKIVWFAIAIVFISFITFLSSCKEKPKPVIVKPTLKIEAKPEMYFDYFLSLYLKVDSCKLKRFEYEVLYLRTGNNKYRVLAENADYYKTIYAKLAIAYRDGYYVQKRIELNPEYLFNHSEIKR